MKKRCAEQAKSAEVSAAKRKNREQDLEPTERDYDGRDTDGEAGAEDAGGSAAGKGGGGGGKKRRRDAAPAEGNGSRGEDLDRLKKGFLGGGKGGAGGARGAAVGPAAAASSAEDYVQPKKKKASKGPS